MLKACCAVCVVLPQVCVQGIPWKYTWKELKELLAECGEVERADVMSAPDGRSKVRFHSQRSVSSSSSSSSRVGRW
jgi:RNA recognition motif-containing protein